MFGEMMFAQMMFSQSLFDALMLHRKHADNQATRRGRISWGCGRR